MICVSEDGQRVYDNKDCCVVWW